MLLGKRKILRKRSLLVPVLCFLAGAMFVCRVNLPEGGPEVPITSADEEGLSFLGDVIQGAGNVLMATAGDWRVTDLGVLKVARWRAKGWLADEEDAETVWAVCLPFTEGWRELERR